MPRLALPQVTLCAASSVNVAATMAALQACLAQIEFATCIFFTDADVVPDDPRIMLVPIPRLGSAAAYSAFMLTGLVDHVDTSHALVVQWDGHVLDAARWQAAFLDHDYIGASWPQFSDGQDVGNGGFSLRSRRLLEACRSMEFRGSHPEDVAICRHNRTWLEDRGLRFAPRPLADVFSAERAGSLGQSFGFHGVWNMPSALGLDQFWAIYRELDDRGSVGHDFAALIREVWQGPDGAARALRMLANRVRDAIGP